MLLYASILPMHYAVLPTAARATFIIYSNYLAISLHNINKKQRLLHRTPTLLIYRVWGLPTHAFSMDIEP